MIHLNFLILLSFVLTDIEFASDAIACFTSITDCIDLVLHT